MQAPLGQEQGQNWESVAKLCDFNPKGNKNTKDVSRMRSILLQLKQTPLKRWWEYKIKKFNLIF